MKKLLMVMAAGFMLTVAAPTEAAAAETNESNAPYCYEQQGNGCWGNPGRWSNEDGSDRGDRGGYHGGCRGGYGGGHHRGNW